MEKSSANTWHQPTNEQRMEKDFEIIVEEYKKVNLALDLIMVIFPFKVSLAVSQDQSMHGYQCKNRIELVT